MILHIVCVPACDDVAEDEVEGDDVAEEEVEDDDVEKEENNDVEDDNFQEDDEKDDEKDDTVAENEVGDDDVIIRKSWNSAHMWHGSHGSKDDTHKTRRECRNPFQFT